MSLTGALHVGRSGLAANQAAMEVTGNNMANAATVGYTRQSAVLSPAGAIEGPPGMFIGTGVKMESIVRATDEALLTRLRSAVSDQHAALAQQDLLSQIETIHSELSDYGMSTRLNDFFDAWSELANNPIDNSLRSLVVQQGQALTAYVKRVHEDLVEVRRQIDDSIRGNVSAANSLLDQIAALNSQIVTQERGQGGANNLRDERDQLVAELAEYVDISTVLQSGGSMDVFIGSIPIVLSGVNRGLRVEYASDDNGDLEIEIRIDDDGALLEPTSGKIGQRVVSREQDVETAIDELSDFTEQLIRQTNLVHSRGQGTGYFDRVTGTYAAEDAAEPMTRSEAGLDFVPNHGSFQIHVTQVSTNTRQAEQIAVDLNGVGGPDMSLNDLAAAIDAVANISATVTPERKLQITADSSDFKFSFSDDSSGVLAALGINTFFTGTGSNDIDMNEKVADDPTLLAAGQGHVTGDNRNALEIAALQDEPLDALGDLSLREKWSRHIEDLAVKSQRAQQEVSATDVIVGSLEAQRQAISGVSLDEESINLLAYQRGYQASARFLTVVDEMMQTLLGLLG